ncbi:MAG: YbaK/EbsC family protein [Spirochaetes bacterium]|nr:YbaK/EbsC family protein [Spirochaetota bacterium]
MPGQKVKDYLDENGIAYVSIKHSPAYTAQGIAQSAHISGKLIAKTVILKIDGKLSMVVLPGNRKVILELLKDIISAKSVELADEAEFKKIFPDCETGAMPPFGNLYGMEVVVSEDLAADREIAFNAGTHSELIQMEFKDYKRLVNPRILNLTM